MTTERNSRPTPSDPPAPEPPARTAARRQLVELVRQHDRGVLPFWLLYEEDHYETISGDGFGLLLDLASPSRDEVHEIARGRAALLRCHVFHVYRADLRIGPGGALQVAVELDSTYPGEFCFAHEAPLTAEALVEALGRPRVVEAGSGWPPSGASELRLVPGPGLGRPFETPVAVIEAQLATVEREVRDVERQLGRTFRGLPEWTAAAAGGLAIWRRAAVEHGRPAVAQLRAALAGGRSPRPALGELRHLQRAAHAFHETVTALQEAARRDDASEALERLSVLVSECGANLLWAWLRVRRESTEIARLVRAARHRRTGEGEVTP